MLIPELFNKTNECANLGLDSRPYLRSVKATLVDTE